MLCHYRQGFVHSLEPFSFQIKYFLSQLNDPEVDKPLNWKIKPRSRRILALKVEQLQGRHYQAPSWFPLGPKLHSVKTWGDARGGVRWEGEELPRIEHFALQRCEILLYSRFTRFKLLLFLSKIPLQLLFFSRFKKQKIKNVTSVPFTNRFFKLKLKIDKQQNQPMIFTFLLPFQGVTNIPKIIFFHVSFFNLHLPIRNNNWWKTQRVTI